MSLSKILEEIKKVEPLVKEDVEGGPVETLIARRGRKNQAVESMYRLKRAYSAEFRNTAAFIVVTGSKRTEFTAAAIKHKCFSADPNEYFSKLVSRVPSELYLGKENLANTFDILGRHMEDLAHDLDIIGYPQLIFRQEYHRHVNNRQEFLSLVRQAVVNQVGGEIVGIQAVKTLTDSAIERRYAAKFAPILLTTDDERFALRVSEDLARISSRVFLVTAGETTEVLKNVPSQSVEEPTEDSVKSTLKSISNSLRR
jgi:hypothetical protein